MRVSSGQSFKTIVALIKQTFKRLKLADSEYDIALKRIPDRGV